MNTLIAILISITLFLFAQIASAQTFDRLYVFGDSLSDNGNAYDLSRGYQPHNPYYYGRYSNGILWPEILTHDFQLPVSSLTDVAFAGAETSGYASHVPGLVEQVDLFLMRNNSVDPDAIYMIWAGGNNFLHNPLATDDAIQSAVEDIDTAIKKLSEHGASRFLILNLPDLGIIPVARLMDDDEHILSKTLTRDSRQFNRLLDTHMDDLQTEYGFSIMRLDIYELIHNISDNPNLYRMKDVEHACYQGKMHDANPALVCHDPDAFLYWDEVHPTHTGHKYIAAAAKTVIKAHGYKARLPFVDNLPIPSSNDEVYGEGFLKVA